MKKTIALAILFASSLAFSAVVPNGIYLVDTDHAHVGFSVNHLGISNVQGQFKKFNGNMNFTAGGDSAVEFEIDASSVNTNQSRRDRHIKSEDFFDVESYPTIKFVSTAIEYTEAGELKSITGDLNFHGETKSVTFVVSLVGSGIVEGSPRAGYLATTKLNRSDFGVSSFQGVVGEEIIVTVNVEVIKQ